MEVAPVIFAVPGYAFLIGLEAGWSRVRRTRTYDAGELLANTSAGLGQLVTDVWLGTLYVVPYAFLLYHARIHQFSDHSAVAWALAIIGVDFAFYWQHRISHRINFIWAAHVVHHQPEAYNLGVALRQPWFSVLTNWIYYQPLALLGIPTTVFVGSVAINLIYQFYLHTVFVGNMGTLGYVLNTPSHHRVHHGRNARYLDKNYGGILIVWDRLFGTFEEETEPVDFGTTAPFVSRNAVWANFAYVFELCRRGSALPVRDRLLLPFRPPEWRAVGEVSPRAAAPPRRVGRLVYGYAAFTTLSAIVGSALLTGGHHPPLASALGAISILWALCASGGLLDGRSWAQPFEAVRLMVTALAWTLYATIG